MLKRRWKLVSLGLLVLTVDLILFRAGSSVSFLDGRLAYSPAQLYALLDQQGASGRHLYTQLECLDLVFIALYSIFFTLLIRVSSSRVDVPPRIGFLAIASMAIFDLAETTGILALLALYPARIEWLARTVSICTPLKWASLGWLLLELARAWGRILARRREPSAG